ncbi:hypothetical protein F5882DRAFT_516605 [Hyaloscypha sp. PMI_1271]|nr:hypothetical protein F5882DRAFT_516605 [Hyaloscypha sp. PMI_1271]
MDGLSVIASVVAVIQISAQVFDLCRTYYLNVKDARRDIQRLRHEVNSLQDILANVADLANAQQPSFLQTLSLIGQKDGPLEQCRLELTALLAKLDPGEGTSKVKLALRSLKWPLHSKEIDQVLLAIGRYKSSFVVALSTDQASLSLAISRDVSDIKNHLESQKLDEDRESIIKWLSTTDPSVNFHASCRKCQPETGQWLITRPDFKYWREFPNSFLWLSTIIRHLQQFSKLQPNYAVAYFYFDFNSTAKQEVTACLSSLVAQLCTHLTTLRPHISQLYERCNHGKLQPGLGELTGMLSEVIQSLGHVFIVIDALDECPKGEERDSLLAVLSNIKSRTMYNLHTLVTSRRELDVEENLAPLITSQPISLQGVEVDSDIQAHISSVLATDPKLKKWPDDIKQEIEVTLAKGANGMFRWVFCQLDALKRCLKVSLIRKALRDLPKTLDDTYSRLFLEIDDAYREEAMKAMLWLAFSDRPLLLAELAEAIVIRPLSHPPFDPEERFPDPESVLQILSSLVSFNDAGGDLLWRMGTVTLAHFSVKEYLISDRIQKGPAQYFATSSHIAHHFIAECCLLYVLHYASTAIKMGSLGDLAAFPLITYASASWFKHINMLPVEQQKPLTPLALKLLLSADALSSWERIRLGNPTISPDEGALYYASSLGLLDVIEELLATGWDPYEWENRSPLHVAAIECRARAAFLLLSHRADVNAKDYMGYTPLHHAAEKGDKAITKLLFQFGALASPRHDYGITPLHLAACHSHEEFAGFLVERGAEVEVAAIHDLRTPLRCAVWDDSRPLIELFLKQGANINAQSRGGETALHHAAIYNQIILQDLLDNGADLELETYCGETPLFCAAEAEQREATETLVKAGARITSPLLLLASLEFPSAHNLQFHLLLDVGMAANEEAALVTLLALKECARLGYTLCGECHRILSEVSGGSTIEQIRNLVKNLELPD